ncbi:MAG: AraC family transcriptional regulator [Alistipes sp.]
MHELTPLSEQDCLYVIERKKREFTFPIHTHREYELNYIENAAGAQRIVGDSVEMIGKYDLVLITGENLEHAWQTHKCVSKEIREITIQFAPDLLNEEMLQKNQFQSIRKMFDNARQGVAFPLSTIIMVRSLLTALTSEEQGFYSHINFLALMHELSLCPNPQVLSSSSFARSDQGTESERIKKIDAYLQQHYSDKILLEEVAALVTMNPVAFSRFFHLRSGKNFTDYVTDLRIGHVIRLLVDSNHTIAEICYSCGFNNISNFNRIFRKKKGCTPNEFREIYKKKRMIF